MKRVKFARYCMRQWAENVKMSETHLLQIKQRDIVHICKRGDFMGNLQQSYTDDRSLFQFARPTFTNC